MGHWINNIYASCDRCVFWKDLRVPDTSGECRRRAPELSHATWLWPSTFRNHWCGEFVQLEGEYRERNKK